MLLLGQDLFKLAQCKWWCWNVNRDLGKSRATPLPKFCGLFSQWGLKRTVRSSLLPEKGISKEARTVNFPYPNAAGDSFGLEGIEGSGGWLQFSGSVLDPTESHHLEVRRCPCLWRDRGPSQDEIGNPGCNLSSLGPRCPRLDRARENLVLGVLQALPSAACSAPAF